jgi:hypothetical protein
MDKVQFMHSTIDQDSTDLSISRGYRVERKMTLSSRDGGRQLWRSFAVAAPVFLLSAMMSATAFAQTLTIADRTFDHEGEAPGDLTFTVSLDQDPGGNTYTVDYATTDATAVDGAD